MQNENQIPLFDIFYPRDWVSSEERETYFKLASDLQRIIQNKFKEKLEVPKIFDPVLEEGKKEEKKVTKKDPKTGKEIVVQEEEEIREQEVFDYTELLMKGRRDYITLEIHYNLPQLYKSAEKIVPAPVYPDPNSLPVPEALFHQIVTKPEEN